MFLYYYKFPHFSFISSRRQIQLPLYTMRRAAFPNEKIDKTTKKRQEEGQGQGKKDDKRQMWDAYTTVRYGYAIPHFRIFRGQQIQRFVKFPPLTKCGKEPKPADEAEMDPNEEEDA